MHVDFKTTVWERVHIPEEKENEVLGKIELGLLNSTNDILMDSKLGIDEFEELYDTSTQMKPKDNKRFSTIEVHKSENYLEDKIYWKNGK